MHKCYSSVFDSQFEQSRLPSYASFQIHATHKKTWPQKRRDDREKLNFLPQSGRIDYIWIYKAREKQLKRRRERARANERWDVQRGVRVQRRSSYRRCMFRLEITHPHDKSDEIQSDRYSKKGRKGSTININFDFLSTEHSIHKSQRSTGRKSRVFATHLEVP